MLRVRKNETEAFRRDALRDFEDRMIEHLSLFSPRHFQVLGNEDVRRVIQHGMARAERHRLESERSVRYWVDAMFVLGGSFDEDPLLPWAARALAESAGEHEDARIDRLNALVWHHVESIRPDLVRVDEGGSVFVEEIRTLREEPNELFTPLSMGPLPKRAADWLGRLFPSKCRRAGEDCVRRSIDLGIERSIDLGLGTPRGALMLVAMRFVLGSGCTEDPLLPWLPPILRDPAVFAPPERVDRVFGATVSCLRRWWK